MSITIKDVARVAGVSISTVSKVINGSPRISQPTIDKVNETIKSLNYVPNKRGRDLSSKYLKRIIFITKVKRNMSFINPHLFEVMIGAEKTFRTKGYAMEFVGIQSNSLDTIKRIIEEKSADGILVHASALDSETAKYIVKSKFPHTIIGMPDFPNGVCWIDNNNELSGEIAAKHLINIEKENIAYIGGSKQDSISSIRLKGVKTELEHNMITIDDEFIYNTNSTQKSGYQVTKELLEMPNRPNAIICANNLIVLGCMKALNDHHIKVPEEIAVITFDDYPYALITSPPTTAINIDVFDLGQQAARLLIEKIKKPNYRFQTYMTVPLLVTRESTRLE